MVSISRYDNTTNVLETIVGAFRGVYERAMMIG